MFSHTLCRHEKSDFCACFEKIYDTRKKKGQSTKCKVRALVRTSDSTRPTNVQLARLTSEPSPNDDFYTLVSQRTIIPLYTGAGFYMCPPPPQSFSSYFYYHLSSFQFSLHFSILFHISIPPIHPIFLMFFYFLFSKFP